MPENFPAQVTMGKHFILGLLFPPHAMEINPYFEHNYDRKEGTSC